MDEASLHTVQLHECVDRFRAGDQAAIDELLGAASRRLEKLARRMLGGFPAVRAQVESEDVLQMALIRLVRSLKEVRPDSTRSFYNLAAVQMRRELLDLARTRAAHPTLISEGEPRAEIPAASDADFDRWVHLHEAIERLPIELREVVGLTLYHGWTQAQIAELLQVNDRRIRRLWIESCRRLDEMLSGDLPAQGTI